MFYERLNNIAKIHNTTITKTLNKLCISTGNISHWKKGRLPNGEVLIKIADEFKCSIDYLLGRTDIIEINK